MIDVRLPNGDAEILRIWLKEKRDALMLKFEEAKTQEDRERYNHYLGVVKRLDGAINEGFYELYLRKT